MEKLTDRSPRTPPAPPLCRCGRLSPDHDNLCPNRGVVPVPKDVRGKLVDALARALWLLEAPKVKDARALKGYQVDYVIDLAKQALKAAAEEKHEPAE